MITRKYLLLTSLLYCTIFNPIDCDDCKPAKKEPKGANKLKKLIEEQNKIEAIRNEALTKEWNSPVEGANEEIFTIFNKPRNPACSYSYYKDPVRYADCKSINLTEFATSTSLIGPFTNGRLGNQMSAYATGYGLSKLFNLDLVILKSQYDHLKPYFPNISEDLVVEKRFCHHCNLPWRFINFGRFRKIMAKNGTLKPGFAISLTAYPNEPEFYKDYVTDLRNQFQLDDRFKQMANQRIERIISGLEIQNREDLVLVGVHFRGTDFAAIMKTTKKRQDVTEKFYGKAFDFYRKKFSDKKLLFLVVSDDPKMAKFVLKVKQNPHGDIVMAGALAESELVAKETISKTTTTATTTTADSSKLSKEETSTSTKSLNDVEKEAASKTTTLSEDFSQLSKVDALGLDLGILSACDHIIATYSTFGMWAGHLAGGMTVMSIGLEPHEEKVRNATFPNWHFFTDD